MVATDRDNDMIEYSITGGNNDGIFDIPILIVRISVCDIIVFIMMQHFYIFFMQSGSVEIVKPEIVDYETTKSFSLIVTATDVLLPTNLRRTVLITTVHNDTHIDCSMLLLCRTLRS